LFGRRSTLLESLGTIRDPRLHKPALKPTTMHLFDARMSSTTVSEADSDNSFRLSVEQYGVLDFAKLGALLAYVSDKEVGHAFLLVFVFVLFQIFGRENVLEDDDFIPVVGGDGNDRDVVFVPIVEAPVTISKCVWDCERTPFLRRTCSSLRLS
jgi:hypothetical protein